MPATQRRADATRNITAILDAGLACLGRSPDVNMIEIARAAGLGRVTVYGHFPSKEALVDAVVAHAVARAAAALDAVDLDRGSAPDAIARLARSAWEVLSQHRQLRVAGLRHLGPERMREHHDLVVPRVAALIARGQDAGELRTDLPRDWLVATFFAVLHAAADEVTGGRLDPGQAGDVVAATVVPALANRSGTPET